MAFLAPLAGTLAGAAANVAPLLSAGGSILGTVSTISGLNYQAAISEREAAFAERERLYAQEKGQINQQEADLAAKAEIAAMENKQAASGFEVGSGSFEQRRRVASILAKRDALRIRQDADREAEQLAEVAQAKRSEASMARRSRLFAGVGGVFDFGTSLINGAELANKLKASAIRRDAAMARYS